jgi:hypothetical protein
VLVVEIRREHVGRRRRAKHVLEAELGHVAQYSRRARDAIVTIRAVTKW